MDASVVSILLLCAIIAFCQADLSAFSYYETLHHKDVKVLDEITIFSNHHIHRRSIENIYEKPTKRVEFTTLGRHFKLHLQPKRGLFSSDFRAFSVDGLNHRRQSYVDKFAFLEGYLEGEEKNSQVNAFFDNENLVASISTKNDTYYIEPSDPHLPSSRNHTMVTYRASDLKKTWNNEKHGSYCGFVHPDHDEAAFKSPINSNDIPVISDGSFAKQNPTKRREKRATNDDKTTCRVMLVADHKYYASVGQNDFTKTVNYLIAEMARVDAIYRAQDFNGYTGLGFEIAEIMVYKQATPTNGDEKHYNMAGATWQTEDLLKEFSKEKQLNKFCLGHFWTSIAFSNGVLGLGWIAEKRRGSVGGICSAKSGAYTYNTAWTTALNKYGKRVSTLQMDIVTAHEFGHNWGSQHDPATSECAPSQFNGGKFVMYTYSVPGYEDNNNKFSPCSSRSISAVLDAKKSGCFTVKSESFCGNLKVESQYEECDAGTAGDSCCDNKCKLQQGAVCSDINSDCCQNCQFAPASVVCLAGSSDNTTCEATTQCTGTSGECPAASFRADNAVCIDKGRCKSGNCLAFCESQGLVSCRCETLDDSCKFCCKTNSSDNCQPYGSPPMNLASGKSCVQGICNENGVCEKQVIGFSGRFFSIIENLSVDYVLEWMKKNIVIAAIIISLIIYVPICIIICIVDYRKEKADKEEIEWHKKENDSLYLDKDKNRIRTGYSRSRTANANGNNSANASQSENQTRRNSRNAVAPM